MTPTWEQVCREFNIPADRQGLVKRNIELKHKLVEAHKTIEVMMLSIHKAFDHPGEFADCDRATCVHGRALLAEARKDV